MIDAIQTAFYFFDSPARPGTARGGGGGAGKSSPGDRGRGEAVPSPGLRLHPRGGGMSDPKVDRQEKPQRVSRRYVLKAAAVAAGGGATPGFPMVVKAQGPITMGFQGTRPP